jgi:hypothetical protein
VIWIHQIEYKFPQINKALVGMTKISQLKITKLAYNERHHEIK